jgi:hypothetical protein
MYSSTLFVDLGIRNGWSVSVTPRPLSTPGKDPVPIVQEAGPQGRSGQVRKISPSLEFDPQTVQPVASRYTDWATRLTGYKIYNVKLKYTNYIFLYDSFCQAENYVSCLRPVGETEPLSPPNAKLIINGAVPPFPWTLWHLPYVLYDTYIIYLSSIVADSS